jgi:uncharacterized membrane protein AbrB (regulator of aidB expression)
MKYLIIGAIVCLLGIGLMQIDQGLIGIIVLLIGAAIGFKGRRKINND